MFRDCVNGLCLGVVFRGYCKMGMQHGRVVLVLVCVCVCVYDKCACIWLVISIKYINTI